MTIKRNVVNQVTKQCPYCKGELRIDPAWIGQKLECPYCNQKFILNDSASEPGKAHSAPSGQFVPDERTSAVTCEGEQAVGTKSNFSNPRRLSIVALSIASVSLIMSLITLVVFLTSGSPSSGGPSKSTGGPKSRRIVIPKECKLVPSDSMNPNLLLQTMSSKGAVFRATVETSSFYPTSEGYYESHHWSACVRFYVTDEWKVTDVRCTAFAKKDSEVGRKLLKVFEKGEYSPCLIHLERGAGYRDYGYCDIVDIEAVNVE